MKRGEIHPLRGTDHCGRGVPGGPYPRLNAMGAIDFCLGQQFATYTKEYPDPGRVLPLPVSILHCMDSVPKSGSPRDKSIADLAWISFFFLLRPGEYCTSGTYNVSTPFNLRDIQFFVVNKPTQATKASSTTCAASTFVRLLFTMQKNGVKGESIGHCTTRYPRACEVAGIWRHVAHLRQHRATPDTHLTAVFNGFKFKKNQQNQNFHIFNEPYCTILTILRALVGFCDVVLGHELLLDIILDPRHYNGIYQEVPLPIALNFYPCSTGWWYNTAIMTSSTKNIDNVTDINAPIRVVWKSLV